MKKIILFVFAFLVLTCSIFAQSVTVTPKKTTYKRAKPIADFKKTFTVTYPKISGVSAALAKKIETAVSYEKTVNLNIKEEMGEYQWLEEADFTVNYNKNGLLDITLTAAGTAAYPSQISKTVVIDLKTGNLLKPTDVFVKPAELVAFVKKAQAAEVTKAKADIKKDEPDADADAFFGNTDFTAENLADFSVSDKGVTFIYDYGFPHVAKALQPEGRFFFTWAQMKPYIKRDGLLAKFIK